MQRISQLHEVIWRTKVKPEADVERTGLTDDQVKTWCYWCRRLVDAGQAVAADGGRVPSMDEVKKMPGEIPLPSPDLDMPEPISPDLVADHGEQGFELC